MPRKRDLHPGLFTNEQLWRAEHDSGLPLRIAYAGLWCHCDRNGAFAWEPGRLKLGVLPWDAVDFEAVLSALADAEFVVRYEVNGKVFGLVPTFAKRQNPHPKEAAVYPLPSSLLASGKQVARKRKASGKTPASNAFTLTPNTLTPNTDPMAEMANGTFAEAWAEYPPRPNNPRAKAERAWEARIAEGIQPASLLAGVRAYAAYVRREQIKPQFVKLAATFFGPDRHWETDYGPAPVAAVQVYDDRGEITPEAARTLGLA